MYIYRYIQKLKQTTNLFAHLRRFHIHRVSHSPSVTPGDVLFAHLHCGRGGLFGLFYRRGDRQVHDIYVHNEAWCWKWGWLGKTQMTRFMVDDVSVILCVLWMFWIL